MNKAINHSATHQAYVSYHCKSLTTTYTIEFFNLNCHGKRTDSSRCLMFEQCNNGTLTFHLVNTYARECVCLCGKIVAMSMTQQHWYFVSIHTLNQNQNWKTVHAQHKMLNFTTEIKCAFLPSLFHPLNSWLYYLTIIDEIVLRSSSFFPLSFT